MSMCSFQRGNVLIPFGGSVPFTQRDNQGIGAHCATCFPSARAHGQGSTLRRNETEIVGTFLP